MNPEQTKTDAERAVKRSMLEQMLLALEADWYKIRADRFKLEAATPPASPREVAMFRKEVNRFDDRIADIAIMFDVTVAATRSDELGQIPSPSRVDVRKTLLNYDNKR